MAFFFEAGNHPNRFVYLGESYRTLEGSPRNRRVRVGKCYLDQGVRVYFPDFLQNDTVSGIKIPKDLKEQAILEMTKVRETYPELLAENYISEHKGLRTLSQKKNQALFSLKDIQDSKVSNYGVELLLEKAVSQIGLPDFLKLNFNSKWEEIISLGTFLAAPIRSLRQFSNWARDSFLFSCQMVTNSLDSLLGEKPLQSPGSFLVDRKVDVSVFPEAAFLLRDTAEELDYHDGFFHSLSCPVWFHEVKVTKSRNFGPFHPLYPGFGEKEGTPCGLSVNLLRVEEKIPQAILDSKCQVLVGSLSAQAFKNLVESYPGVDILAEIPFNTPVIRDLQKKYLYEENVLLKSLLAESKENLGLSFEKVEGIANKPVSLLFEKIYDYHFGLRDPTTFRVIPEKDFKKPQSFALDNLHVVRTEIGSWRIYVSTLNEISETEVHLLRLRSFLEREYQRMVHVIFSDPEYRGLSENPTAFNLPVYVALVILRSIFLIWKQVEPEALKYVPDVSELLTWLEDVSLIKVKDVMIFKNFQEPHKLILQSLGIRENALQALEVGFDSV
ncbi:MAG: hypothetical protein LBF22_06155 [Deltaproteobacteria bacterium]|jgi:hypothetical protein|nr:hypothetical protein [Deltaproteobacteria bacterium]